MERVGAWIGRSVGRSVGGWVGVGGCGCGSRIGEEEVRGWRARL